MFSVGKRAVLSENVFLFCLHVAKTTLFGVIVELWPFISIQTMESKLFCEV